MLLSSFANVLFAIITINRVCDVGCLPLTPDDSEKDGINGQWNSTMPIRLGRSDSNSSNELVIRLTTASTVPDDITAAIAATTERPFQPMNHKEALLNHKQQCIEMMNRTYTNQEERNMLIEVQCNSVFHQVPYGESSVQHLEMLHSVPDDKLSEGRKQINTLHLRRGEFVVSDETTSLDPAESTRAH